MKKVGLAVCYDTKNFGSQLQVLATNEKIKQLGYTPEIIRYKKKISVIFMLQTIPRFFNPYFIKSKFGGRDKKKFIKNNPEIEQNIKIRNKKFVDFVKDNFTNLSPIYNGWKDLKKQSKNNYDIFLCGSDQLWLPSNLGSHFYTLEFAPSEKIKISYATSFGMSYIPWFQKNNTKKYLNRIQYLSTREIKGSEIIKEISGRDAKVVVDPTLLLSKEEWENIIPNKKIIDEKYIFCYFLGTNIEHRKKAEELKNKTGYKIVNIPFLDNYVEYDKDFGDYKLFDINSFDFVNLIRNAEYVLTDSFHGTIFSIINEKKFLTFNRFSNNSSTSRNSRIDSLFKLLDLNNRRFNSSSEINNQIKAAIDYKNVKKKMIELKNNSVNYLNNSLNGKDTND